PGERGGSAGHEEPRSPCRDWMASRSLICRGNHSIIQPSEPTENRRSRPMLNEALLSLLACPLGKAPLRREGDAFTRTKCGQRFAIEDDIPNMLIKEASRPAGCRSLADLACVKSGEAKLD